jgi:hypothetical protein
MSLNEDLSHVSGAEHQTTLYQSPTLGQSKNSKIESMNRSNNESKNEFNNELNKSFMEVNLKKRSNLKAGSRNT